MLSNEEIQEKLKDRNLAAVAQSTGLSYETVRKIANNGADNVRYSNVVALIKYLERK